MNLPLWYIERAEDYLSILRSAQEYSQSEICEATRNQRIAEYKLMKEKMGTDDDSNMAPPAPPPSVNLRQYDNSIMSRGHYFQADRPKPSVTRGFWENILK
tara:strand:+ start:199 stop:501 length:303 start_codon:yes stop_codon:yes gene_type:complete